MKIGIICLVITLTASQIQNITASRKIPIRWLKGNVSYRGCNYDCYGKHNEKQGGHQRKNNIMGNEILNMEQMGPPPTEAKKNIKKESEHEYLFRTMNKEKRGDSYHKNQMKKSKWGGAKMKPKNKGKIGKMASKDKKKSKTPFYAPYRKPSLYSPSSNSPSNLHTSTPSLMAVEPSLAPTPTTNSPTRGPIFPASDAPSSQPTSLNPSFTPSSTTVPPTTTAPIDTTLYPTNTPTSATSTPSKPPFPAAPTMSPSIITALPTATPTPQPVSVVPTNQPTLSVKQRILPYSLYGGNEFINATSYQSLSLSFVQSIPEVVGISDSKLVQYYTLGCIYFATFGVPNPVTDAVHGAGYIPPGWVYSTNWLNGTVDPCKSPGWLGITCLRDRITNVELRENSLTGTFPPEITILSADNLSKSGNLSTLDLSSNVNLFAERLESWIGSLGSNMQSLNVRETSFYASNGVPDAISNLTTLQKFDCAYSLLFGPLRDSPFIGLNQLAYLSLSGNSYNSTIPTVFRSLPNLQYLFLQDGYFSGDLSFADGLQSVRELWVDQNPGISGPVFSFFGSLSTLQSLSLADCHLSGTFPPEISNSTNMLEMLYYNNRIGGTVPQEWGALTRLRRLEIEANAISGDLTDFCSRVSPPAGALKILGADCKNLTACPCCTCCSLKECNAI